MGCGGNRWIGDPEYQLLRLCRPFGGPLPEYDGHDARPRANQFHDVVHRIKSARLLRVVGEFEPARYTSSQGGREAEVAVLVEFYGTDRGTYRQQELSCEQTLSEAGRRRHCGRR